MNPKRRFQELLLSELVTTVYARDSWMDINLKKNQQFYYPYM